MEKHFEEYLPQKDGKQTGVGVGRRKCSYSKLSFQGSLNNQVNYTPRNRKKTGNENFQSGDII